jgi:hypothetical protein
MPEAKIVDTSEADYACRIATDGATVLAILGFLGRTLDYANFKDKVDATPDQGRKPYHEVWRVMANSLGAYGRKGHR